MIDTEYTWSRALALIAVLIYICGIGLTYALIPAFRSDGPLLVLLSMFFMGKAGIFTSIAVRSPWWHLLLFVVLLVVFCPAFATFLHDTALGYTLAVTTAVMYLVSVHAFTRDTSRSGYSI